MPSFSQMPLGEFVELAASNSPTPGGGGIAALAGALGTAMASMATNFTIGKPRFVQHEEEMQDILAKLGVLTEEFLDAIDADAAAFTRITDAYGLPKATDEEKAKRREAISDAVFAAMQVPLSLLRKCVKAAELLPSLAGAGNPNLLSDVEVAGIMIEA